MGFLGGYAQHALFCESALIPPVAYHCNSTIIYVMRPRQMRRQQQQQITPMSMHLCYIAPETQFHLRSL